MDRTKAIELLKIAVPQDEELDEEGLFLEAINMAVEALKQPEVIRCKDCAFYEKEIGGNDDFALGMCKFIEQHYVANTGFCFWAKRIGEANDKRKSN